MQLIGLSGYARSGKDEAAKVLMEEFGFQRIAFADKLRDFLYALNPVVSNGEQVLNDFDKKYVRLRDVIDRETWDGYKKGKYSGEIRNLLQRLGTEAGRNTLWDSIWIDAALHNLDPEGSYVITDARFPNEAAAIQERGGRLWRITRSGVGPANQHPSETSLDDYKFDYTIWNNSTLEDYHQQVRDVMAMYKQDADNWQRAVQTDWKKELL